MSEGRLDWIYSSPDHDELRRRYDSWAASCDDDLAALDWRAPHAAARHLAGTVERAAVVLDAGCGTGLVGRALHELGFDDIVGLDFSAGVLAQARERRVYRELHHGSLLDRLPFGDGSFGAVVAVGVFTLGHLSGAAFDELARVTARGGHVVVALRTTLPAPSGASTPQIDSGPRAYGGSPIARIRDPSSASAASTS